LERERGRRPWGGPQEYLACVVRKGKIRFVVVEKVIKGKVGISKYCGLAYYAW